MAEIDINEVVKALDNIEVNTQSSIRIKSDVIIYFDPFQIKEERHDADYILITHDHYDHLNLESIKKLIKGNDTIIITPDSALKEIHSVYDGLILPASPVEYYNFDHIYIDCIPAYNINKPYHPEENNWVGYLVQINNGITYYIAGDTDVIPEMDDINCNVAFVPIGGKFTMDVNEAAELMRKLKPQVVIPIHYGSIVGNKNDGKKLKELLSDTDIMVVEKL